MQRIISFLWERILPPRWVMIGLSYTCVFNFGSIVARLVNHIQFDLSTLILDIFTLAFCLIVLYGHKKEVKLRSMYHYRIRHRYTRDVVANSADDNNCEGYPTKDAALTAGNYVRNARNLSSVDYVVEYFDLPARSKDSRV